MSLGSRSTYAGGGGGDNFYHKYNQLFDGDYRSPTLNGLHQQRIGYLNSLIQMRQNELQNSINKQMFNSPYFNVQ